MRHGRISSAAVIADIRGVARLLGHSPSSVEYARHGRYNVTTVRRRFGRSWGEIVGAAGLRYVPRTTVRIPTEEELRKDVSRVARKLGRAPNCAEYEELGSFGAGVVRRRSGMRRWEDAVAAIAGLDREEVKLSQARGGRRYRTTDEWLGRLRALADELGRAPTTAEANAGGINPHELRARVGGRWEDVLRRAGVDPGKRKRHALLLSTPTEVILEDVVRVTRRLGRAPTFREYEAHGHYSGISVRGRLGGWKRVKREAVRRGISGG